MQPGEGIEYLAFEEDTFDGWQRGTDKEFYAFIVSGNGLFQLLDAVVDGVAFEEVVFQDLVGPASEFYTSL